MCDENLPVSPVSPHLKSLKNVHHNAGESQRARKAEVNRR